MRQNTYFINEGKRIQLREKVINGAEKYNHYLVNKVFLVVCEDGSEYTLKFLKSDFRHLTGIDTDLNDDAFFEFCKSRRLDIGNINEYQKYNWSTLKSKSVRISQIHRILYDNIQNTLFMINLHTNTRTFPVAIKNTNINTCIGFVGEHKARTLRKYNNSNNADNQKRILLIIAKKQDETLYNELVYTSSIENLHEQNGTILTKMTEKMQNTFLKVLENAK